jgi:hypothetical protein
MNVELVAQMFKNYQSNVLFHLEGRLSFLFFLFWFHSVNFHLLSRLKRKSVLIVLFVLATENLKDPS